MRQDNVFVFALGRTPFGKFQGGLSGYDPIDLGALALDEMLARAKLPPEAIEQVTVGMAMLGGSTLTAARQMILKSRLAFTTPSLGVDRACCSGMSAIAIAAAQVASGAPGLVLAGGVESLSLTPRLLARSAPLTGSLAAEDPLLLKAPFGDSIASYTSQEAIRLGVGREEQDAWALQSHQRYTMAEQQGFFAFERFAVPARPAGRAGSAGMLDHDEGPRADTSLEALARLPTVRASATVTAGNAPGLNDGAAFVLLGSAQAGRAHGLKPLARLVGTIAVAEGPTSGTRTSAMAIQRLLERTDTELDEVGVIEINEAFAATALVSTLVLGGSDASRIQSLRRRTNPNGGAVAIGHPMGASGARLVMTTIGELHRRGGGIGVAAICGGFGQGEAIMVEVGQERAE